MAWRKGGKATSSWGSKGRLPEGGDILSGYCKMNRHQQGRQEHSGTGNSINRGMKFVWKGQSDCRTSE